jgi:redox-sensitive bicupin YhaK (pirin superfamily)
VIISKFPIGFQWDTQEPFLFCAHHYDRYPKGTPSLEPAKEFLTGRKLGHDFELKDGFRMYHGHNIPGFPAHPHRGFETITIVRQGLIDHADSLGAAGRYGNGDVQWMTAGAGVQHSEMFPLLDQQDSNTIELFQVWLNLPKKNKMVNPDFKMFWAENIPRFASADRRSDVQVIAGNYLGVRAIDPPANSWAADRDNEVLMLLVKLDDQGKFHLPPSQGPTNRSLYFFAGDGINLGDEIFTDHTGFYLQSESELTVSASGSRIEFLILQAKSIHEPVVQQGPFVMNTYEEVAQTFEEFRHTAFGGWPWPTTSMTHGNTQGRFARYPDGRTEKPS